jgi:two-component sensor histidine kinase
VALRAKQGGRLQRADTVEGLVGWVTELVRRQSWRRGLVVGLPLFVLAFAIRLALGEAFQSRPYVVFIPVVLATVVVGGGGSGFAMAALSAIVGWYFFIVPYRSFSLPALEDSVAMLSSWLAMGLLVLLVAAFSRSIRDQVAAQNAAATEAEARRVMFHELQHRVANNLQFVAALLGLAAGQVVSAEDGREALADAQRRLQQMARLNRWLHDPEAGHRDLPSLLGAICEQLRDAAGRRDARFEVAVAPEKLPSESLTAIALLVNEAVTNALKHAIRPQEELVVTVRLRREADTLELTVQDNGPGIAEPVSKGQDPARRGSLGLRVMAALASQLGGSLELANQGGTLVRVRFPGGSVMGSPA